MFLENQSGQIPSGADFRIGEPAPLEEPDPDLLIQIGWKASHYDFSFFDAEVLHHDEPTSSWVEIAYSQQLGGAFVLWRSGVPGLETPRSISYGWVESASIEAVAQAIEAKAAVRGPALAGFSFDIEKYYESCEADGRPRHIN